MSDDATARLGLPYLAAGQMQKHVTLNEALTRLDALAQTAVVSRTVAAQPADPDDGALYILPAAATGAVWAGRSEGDLMRFEAGGWTTVETPDGLTAVVLDEPAILIRLGGDWSSLGEALGEIQQLTRLGLGTAADATNPFAAKLNKALWTARGTGEGGDGDLRLTLNKQTAADVLSLLFQSGYGGRAELGLVGDDDFRLKVSADGATWTEAMTVAAATGQATFARGAARLETTVLTADGGWTPPVWARWVEAVAIGAGGGGGAGASGPSGAPRFGGGGGGAGGVSGARWPASALSAGLAIEVGAGGAGGAATGTVGADASDGEFSRLSLGGADILVARGGKGGVGGDGASGHGGAGGQGDGPGNDGGASSVSAAGGAGRADQAVAGPGGGGAGGGLNAADTVRAGGVGGIGGALRVAASGGAGGSGAVGAPGAACPTPALSRAGGGGGGGGASTSTGHAGGAGGGFGAGGGGGGAGVSSGGAGGAGAAGVVVLTAIG